MSPFLSDLSKILIWYFFIQILSLAVFPLVARLFPDWADKGWGLAKTVGILFFSYLIWLLSSLHLIKFEAFYLYLVLFILLFISIYFGKLFSFVSTLLKSSSKLLVIEEGLFLLFLIGWSITRGFFPEIRGLEKFMDYGFLVSILNTPYVPPRDMWWAGGTINYYYFGHYITAVLTRLSSLPSEVTYNIQIANIFALAIVGSFSFGY